MRGAHVRPDFNWDGKPSGRAAQWLSAAGSDHLTIQSPCPVVASSSRLNPVPDLTYAANIKLNNGL